MLLVLYYRKHVFFLQIFLDYERISSFPAFFFDLGNSYAYDFRKTNGQPDGFQAMRRIQSLLW